MSNYNLVACDLCRLQIAILDNLLDVLNTLIANNPEVSSKRIYSPLVITVDAEILVLSGF